jgi:hypothetical protein
MHLGCRRLEAAHDAAVGIDAHMCLHAEVLLITLLRGRHLGVLGPRLVLG